MFDQSERDPEVELSIRMSRLTRRRFQLNDARLEKLGIGPGQVPILLEIGRLGDCHQRILAERLDLTPATISAALKRLEKNSLIARIADETDARATVVSLTESGEAACREAKELLRITDRDLCDGISAEECARMIGLLDRMLKNAEYYSGRQESEKTV